jgi:hypothetical protein
VGVSGVCVSDYSCELWVLSPSPQRGVNLEAKLGATHTLSLVSPWSLLGLVRNISNQHKGHYTTSIARHKFPESGSLFAAIHPRFSQISQIAVVRTIGCLATQCSSRQIATRPSGREGINILCKWVCIHGTYSPYRKGRLDTWKATATVLSPCRSPFPPCQPCLFFFFFFFFLSPFLPLLQNCHIASSNPFSRDHGRRQLATQGGIKPTPPPHPSSSAVPYLWSWIVQ